MKDRMNFLYYLPGRTLPVANAARIPEETGLGPLFEGRSLSNAPLMEGGPDGGSGWIFSLPETPFNLELFDWHRVANTAGETTHWIGVPKERESRPGPKDLILDHPIGGKPVRFADDQEWLIPTICLNRSHLPKRMGYRDGRMVLLVPDKYEEILEESYWWLSMLIEGGQGGKITFTPQRFFEWVVSLLSLNYRVGPAEVGLLEILDEHKDTILTVTEVALGIDELKRESEMVDKKKATLAVG